MERLLSIHVEKLPERVYLATSGDVPVLVAQGRTVSETLEIARDVACKLLEAREERQGTLQLPPVEESFDYLSLGGLTWGDCRASAIGTSRGDSRLLVLPLIDKLLAVMKSRSTHQPGGILQFQIILETCPRGHCGQS